MRGNLVAINATSLNRAHSLNENSQAIGKTMLTGFD